MHCSAVRTLVSPEFTMCPGEAFLLPEPQYPPPNVGALTRRMAPNPGPSARSIWGNFLKADPLLHPTEPDFPGKGLRIQIFFLTVPPNDSGTQRVWEAQGPTVSGGPSENRRARSLGASMRLAAVPDTHTVRVRISSLSLLRNCQ